MVNNCRYLTGQTCHPANPKDWLKLHRCLYMMDPPSCPDYEELAIKKYHTPSAMKNGGLSNDCRCND